MASSFSESLFKQIHHVAHNLPEEKLQAIIQAMQQENLSPNSLTRLLPKSDWREMITKLIEVWSNETNPPSLTTVAAMLSTAAYCRQRFQQELSLEFVWTGPIPEGSCFRRTDQALLEVIQGAQQTLTVVSFAIYKIPEILTALQKAVSRGVNLTLIFEMPEESDGKVAYNTLFSIDSALLKRSKLLIWPKNKRPVSTDGKMGSLHAKFAIADDQKIFISSANLTNYAMTLNMEMGILVHSANFASEVSEHIHRLISSGHFVTHPNS
jgi:phosphatidylserine/phosphatidylglycerophosphate/cardiolipin synthase-like enzyme